jgi:hypothetical protein
MSEEQTLAVRELVECAHVTIDDALLFRALAHNGPVGSVDMVFDGHVLLAGACAPLPTASCNEFRLRRPPVHPVRAVVTLRPR